MATAQPYGDAFLVNTPALDRYSQEMYQEQRLRELNRQRQAMFLDKQFGEDVTKMRGADVPDHYNNYSQYKQSQQELSKMNPAKDPQAYIQKQMESRKLLAKTFSHVADSIQQKEDEKAFRQNLYSHPDLYEDGSEAGKPSAFDVLHQSINTPISQVDKLPNLQNTRVNEINFDYGTVKKNAAGTMAQHVPETVTQDPKDKFSSNVTASYFGNDPAKYKDMIIAGLYKKEGGKFAAHALATLPQEEIDAVNKEFDQISPEKWKQMTGSEKPQNLDPKNPDSKAEQWASYEAKKYAITENPELRTMPQRKNEEAINNNILAREKTVQAIRNSDAQGLIEMRHNLDLKDKKTEDAWIDSYLDKTTEEAKTPENRRVFAVGKKETKGYKIPVDPVMAKAVGFDAHNPGEITATDDGHYIISFYKTDKNYAPVPSGNGYVVDPTRNATISKDQLKLALGAKTGVKNLPKEMSHGSKAPSKWDKYLKH